MDMVLSNGLMDESTQVGGKQVNSMGKEPILILKALCVKVFGKMAVENIG